MTTVLALSDDTKSTIGAGLLAVGVLFMTWLFDHIHYGGRK